MRTFLIMMTLLLAAPALGEERTWTIATGVFTAKAELVAVRGDLAYLKIGDKIEQYPLNRLSATDQRYIASLALAPVLPGPGDEIATSDVLPTPGAAAVGGATPADASLLQVTPPANASIVEEAIPLPAGAAVGANTQAAGNRTSNYRASTSLSTVRGSAAYRSNAQSLNANNQNSSNARRYAAQQQQQQTQMRRTASGQQNQQEPPPGILGIRARRTDRSRGR